MLRKFILTKVASENKAQYTEEVEALEVSDGYHTFHELYQHRMALNAALFNFWAAERIKLERFFGLEYVAPPIPKVMKSKLHNDGTMFEGGYFVVLAITVEGQISYHYQLKHWDEFRIPEVERIPIPYDNHTPKGVIERLMKL